MNQATGARSEETLDPEDWEAMRVLGHRILDDAMDYLETLRDRPVWRHAPPQVKAHFAGPPPPDPGSPEEVYREYLECILPYQFGNSHPRFWGWVAGSGTVMGMFAELLAASTDAISGAFSYISNNYVEMQVVDWCKTLLGYPSTATGLLTSGCSASNLIGLSVARNAMAGFDVRSRGMMNAPQQMTLYCSVEAHSSLQKAVELLGFGDDALRRIPVNESMQIDLAALKAAIRSDRAEGFRPVCIVGCAGTTSTAAIDDLNALADICAEEGCWFHVDGACGAWTAIAPKYSHLVAGMERADSLAFDLHKWMYLTYPIGCVLVRDADEHRRAFSLTPTYLAHGEGERGLTGIDVPWLSDYGFELSRGFHALKAWMTIKEHGTERYGRLIEQNIEQAHYLAGLVRAAPELELALPVSLNIVNFRYVRPGMSDAGLDVLNKRIETELQEQGTVVVSTVSLWGRNYLHAGIANHRSRREDFDLLVREVIRIGNALAGSG
ncbi:aminotransferase class V-fold PLP-dependent enzyme [Methanoculleus sp. FWC-SCC1]|uniref:Aminotransferase class V-fold PLP-dependent enzyme n=1 Tax=Methanoculleus frigidifontis TaxID=2584085 RepID=A0ABT8MAX4_9EURY|nr:pyridoxal-dependent decarboxylase [Methanoculleus sp. FWC-SCC1]MDN7025099.1 aminotransferase class V-fold PLP-dependent enzyme [Methanoculleus sp. FWC-SCC1]